MSDLRSKSAVFRANKERVKQLLGEQYGLEGIAETLKAEVGVYIETETLRKYIRREFKKGVRECQVEFSDAKKIMPVSDAKEVVNVAPMPQSRPEPPAQIKESLVERKQVKSVTEIIKANQSGAAASESQQYFDNIGIGLNKN